MHSLQRHYLNLVDEKSESWVVTYLMYYYVTLYY